MLVFMKINFKKRWNIQNVHMFLIKHMLFFMLLDYFRNISGCFPESKSLYQSLPYKKIDEMLEKFDEHTLPEL